MLDLRRCSKSRSSRKRFPNVVVSFRRTDSTSGGTMANEKSRSGFSSKPASLFPLPDCGTAGSVGDTGKPLHTFTIITTHANALVRQIHDRMPVMYRRDMVG